MIYDVLNFLKQRLEAFLSEGRASAEPLIVLANPWSNNDSNKSASFLNAFSLINVEEVNLYVLISAYHKNYDDGLKFLSRVLRFFQMNPVFENTPGGLSRKEELPEGVEKIIVELYTAGFEQQNQIWASLSTGYIPSVIFKIRMIIIDAAVDRAVSVVREIKTNLKSIDPA
jgi:hypothetical protein